MYTYTYIYIYTLICTVIYTYIDTILMSIHIHMCVYSHFISYAYYMRVHLVTQLGILASIHIWLLWWVLFSLWFVLSTCWGWWWSLACGEQCQSAYSQSDNNDPSKKFCSSDDVHSSYFKRNPFYIHIMNIDRSIDR